MTDILSFEPVVARDANDNPVAGAVAEFFATGTTTPVTVYADAAETTPLGTTVTANGNGVFPAVFKSGGAVKVVVKTSLGAVLYTLDPAVKVAATGAAAGGISFSATAAIPETNVQDAIERVQTNLEAKAPLASPALTGVPTAPTPATGTSNTQIATTAYVRGQVLDEDDFATNSAARPPSQQSTKAYVDAEILASAGEIGWTNLAVQALSGTSAVDLTAFPATVTEIDIDFLDMSLSGTGNALVQVLSAGVISSGYVSSATVPGRFTVSSTAGFVVPGNAAARASFGRIRLSKFSAAGWIALLQGYEDVEGFSVIGAGKVTGLVAAVDGVRFTRSGTDTFDGGTIKVRYRS